MAPDWSCCLELLREMDLLCFCPGKGSHWAGVLTFPQPYSPVHNVCVPESLPPSPATRHQHREELSWTQQLPFALLLLPVSPCSSQSTGILGTFKHQMHEQAPPSPCTVYQVCRPQHTSQICFVVCTWRVCLYRPVLLTTPCVYHR